MSDLIVHPDDVLALKELWWPQYTFYDKQIEVIDSVLLDHETYVESANEMGKDFTAGFLIVACFAVCMFKKRSCRVLTTSVREEHLKVMWAEAGKFLTTANVPLICTTKTPEAPFVMNHLELKRAEDRDVKTPQSYAVGMVSEKGEGFAGHYADFTLLIGDECSGLSDKVYIMAQSWAKHQLWLGNPFECQNFWRKAIEGGDILEQDMMQRQARKVGAA